MDDLEQLEKEKADYLKRLKSPASSLAAQEIPEHGPELNANNIAGIKSAVEDNESQPIAKVVDAIGKFSGLRRILGMPTKEEMYGVGKGEGSIADKVVAPLEDFDAKREAVQNILLKQKAERVLNEAHRVQDLKNNTPDIAEDRPRDKLLSLLRSN